MFDDFDTQIQIDEMVLYQEQLANWQKEIAEDLED